MDYSEINRRLVHAVTEYDRKQHNKRGYNIYALPQYIHRVHDVVDDISRGATIREALTDAFTGRLLDVCLKALGEEKSTDSEQRGRVSYTPRRER